MTPLTIGRLVLSLVVSFVAFTTAACAVDDAGDAFLGNYTTTLTVNAATPIVFADAVSIADGATTDLILSSQHAGAIKAEIIGTTTFSIPQQQIMLTDSFGAVFNVTIQGQGSVVDGLINSTGTVSHATEGTAPFTWTGQRL